MTGWDKAWVHTQASAVYREWGGDGGGEGKYTYLDTSVSIGLTDYIQQTLRNIYLKPKTV